MAYSRKRSAPRRKSYAKKKSYRSRRSVSRKPRRIVRAKRSLPRRSMDDNMNNIYNVNQFTPKPYTSKQLIDTSLHAKLVPRPVIKRDPRLPDKRTDLQKQQDGEDLPDYKPSFLQKFSDEFDKSAPSLLNKIVTGAVGLAASEFLGPIGPIVGNLSGAASEELALAMLGRKSAGFNQQKQKVAKQLGRGALHLLGKVDTPKLRTDEIRDIVNVGREYDKYYHNVDLIYDPTDFEYNGGIRINQYPDEHKYDIGFKEDLDPSHPLYETINFDSTGTELTNFGGRNIVYPDDEYIPIQFSRPDEYIQVSLDELNQTPYIPSPVKSYDPDPEYEPISIFDDPDYSENLFTPVKEKFYALAKDINSRIPSPVKDKFQALADDINYHVSTPVKNVSRVIRQITPNARLLPKYNQEFEDDDDFHFFNERRSSRVKKKTDNYGFRIASHPDWREEI